MSRPYIDITGRKFGSFIVQGLDKNSKIRKWLCKCECGNPTIFSFESRYLRTGNPHCGCKSKKPSREIAEHVAIEEKPLYNMYVVEKIGVTEIAKQTGLHRNTISKYVHMYGLKDKRQLYVRPAKQRVLKKRGPKPKALLGKRFGNLTVVEYIDKVVPGGNTVLKCKCDCGNEIEVVSNNLYSLNTTSCGCTRSSIGEQAIRKFLSDGNIQFKEQYMLDGCKYKYKLRFDFAIFSEGRLTHLIEFDGLQHTKPIEYFGGIEAFELTKKRDRIKDKYCKDNRITLIRIPYQDRDNVENILSFLSI